jgi:hypothetical protein
MGAFSLFHILILLVIAGLFIGVPMLIVLLRVSANRKTGGMHDFNNPNLTPCPDCGKYVSRLAVTRPNYGRPLKA